MKDIFIHFSFVIFSVLILCTVGSCGRAWYRVEKRESIDTLACANLPKNVSYSFMQYGTQMKKQFCISTDSNLIKVKYFDVSAESEGKFLWKNGDYFIINGRKIYLKFSPKKDTPFVIDENYIYWCAEWNVTGEEYKTANYCRIRWRTKSE